MNRNQWFVLGIGSILLSMYLFITGEGLCSLYLPDNALYIGCMVRKYAFSIPAIISTFLGWIFLICGFLEPKKK